MRLKYNKDLCYGCKLCALGCSYRRTGAFGLVDSHIQVERDFETSRIDWRLSPGCDRCVDRARPVCVAFCPYGALTEYGHD